MREPSRADLSRSLLRVLKRGARRNPDVLLVDGGSGPVVVKDFAPRAAWVRRLVAPWLVSRELRAYARLQGHPAVPRVLGRVDRLAFALEYRPGERVSRRLAGRVPPGFVAELEEAVAEMHRLGVVHLDLRHRDNVLFGDDGHPVLLDFASAVCFRPRGWAARWVLPWLARVDRSALHKWRVRLGGQAPPAASAGSVRSAPPEGGEAGSGGASSRGRGASRPT